jgi:hypothetical protein
MTYYDILWHTMSYDILWVIMIYYELLWHTMTYYNIQWLIMTYYDLLCLVMSLLPMLIYLSSNCFKVLVFNIFYTVTQIWENDVLCLNLFATCFSFPMKSCLYHITLASSLVTFFLQRQIINKMKVWPLKCNPSVKLTLMIC